MAVVPFVYVDWLTLSPEFEGKIGPKFALSYFNRACFNFVNNTDSSNISDIPTRTMLLYLVTSHIATLVSRKAALVGRISSATEGSVSVSVDMPASSEASAWFMQTPYGLEFWNATLKYRRAQYVPGPIRSLGFGVSRTRGGYGNGC